GPSRGAFSQGRERQPAPPAGAHAGGRLQPGADPADGAPARPAVAARPPPTRPALDRRDATGPHLGRAPATCLHADLAAVVWPAPSERPRGAMARLRTSRATSAGGVVVSTEGDRPSLVVGMRRRGRDGMTCTLP